MSLYVISDLHLSLGCCTKKPMNIFSPRWTDHTVKLKSAWNSIVGIGDTVIVGGDISWAMTLDEAKEDLLFLDSLNGTKILLEGNHDFWWQSISKTVGFIKSLGISSIHLLQNNAYRLDGGIPTRMMRQMAPTIRKCFQERHRGYHSRFQAQGISHLTVMK